MMGKILAIKTSLLFPDKIEEGFIKKNKKQLFKLLKDNSVFLERKLLEEDDYYQQLIPQIILKVGDKIFIHKITHHSNENRLHDLYPIFLGGHVDEGDLSIEEAADREFTEEIDYHGNILNKIFLGLVKLHDNPVNRVHTGLIWIYEGDSLNWGHKDEDLIDGKFVAIKDLPEYLDKMTYWSKLTMPVIMKKFG
jgi:predicted NUDIX family phosphoesterase